MEKKKYNSEAKVVDAQSCTQELPGHSLNNNNANSTEQQLNHTTTDPREKQM
jgi:hypothetical protein